MSYEFRGEDSFYGLVVWPVCVWRVVRRGLVQNIVRPILDYEGICLSLCKLIFHFFTWFDVTCFVWVFRQQGQEGDRGEGRWGRERREMEKRMERGGWDGEGEERDESIPSLLSVIISSSISFVSAVGRSSNSDLVRKNKRCTSGWALTNTNPIQSEINKIYKEKKRNNEGGRKVVKYLKLQEHCRAFEPKWAPPPATLLLQRLQ